MQLQSLDCNGKQKGSSVAILLSNKGQKRTIVEAEYRFSAQSVKKTKLNVRNIAIFDEHKKEAPRTLSFTVH